jgi:hypothetical protein
VHLSVEEFDTACNSAVRISKEAVLKCFTPAEEIREMLLLDKVETGVYHICHRSDPKGLECYRNIADSTTQSAVMAK